MLTPADWKPGYTERSKEIWEQYKQDHDIATDIGKVAAIDPVGGRIWIADSAVAVVNAMDAEGVEVPVFFIRVGDDYFVRKGRR